LIFNSEGYCCDSSFTNVLTVTANDEYLARKLFSGLDELKQHLTNNSQQQAEL